MALFTIIIPHKNRPDLLKKCLDSIPKRKDIQTIVVDDGSDDCIININDFAGQGGSNLEFYFLKESIGPGAARNYGLEHATGKWILFLDSDDFFHPCILDVLEYSEQSTEEIIFFKADGIDLQTGEQGNRGYEFSRRVDVALHKGNFQPALMYSSPWGKVFSREMIENNKIRFPSIRYREDVLFMAEVAIASCKFKALDVIAYCISNSETSKSPSKEILIAEFEQDRAALDIYRKKYKLSRNDKYWFFDSWKGLWKVKKCYAFFYWPIYFAILGFPFLIDSVIAVKGYVKKKFIGK